MCNPSVQSLYSPHLKPQDHIHPETHDYDNVLLLHLYAAFRENSCRLKHKQWDNKTADPWNVILMAKRIFLTPKNHKRSDQQWGSQHFMIHWLMKCQKVFGGLGTKLLSRSALHITSCKYSYKCHLYICLSSIKLPFLGCVSVMFFYYQNIWCLELCVARNQHNKKNTQQFHVTKNGLPSLTLDQ